MRFVPKTITQSANRNAFLIKKHSPTILFGVGVVGMVGSTVLACRATLKLEDALNETKTKFDLVATFEKENYSEEDRAHDRAILYIRGAVTVGKLYAPAVGVGVLSVAALTQSHRVLSQRNAALAAAYAAIDAGFQEYRARVIERYGADEDRSLRYGGEDVLVTNEDGEEIVSSRTTLDGPSIYARFFDPSSSSWSSEPEYNRIFLQCQQNYANDMLHARGHLFLNEVYDLLGLDRSKAGAVVGWTLKKNGDNYVDFGIFDTENGVIDFVNGREHSILLDFNVDGIIYNDIEDES